MNKYVTRSIKTVGWALALLGTGVTRYNGIKGPDTCPEYLPNTCKSFNFNWWALALEWFCLAIFGALDSFGILGRAYVAVTGLFVYASMQLQIVPWLLWDRDMPEETTNLMYVGNALLFGANLFLVTGMGLEHYVQPKLPDDKAPLPVDNKAGGEVRAMAVTRRNAELLAFVRRSLGLILACTGAGSMIVTLVLHSRFCDFDCARNWWTYSVQLFAFVAYIVTEVILEVSSFRPVLTILLATQIRVFEGYALEASGEGANYSMEVAGVIIAISISYILFLTLPGPVTNGPSSGRRALLLGVVPTVAALVGVIFITQSFTTSPLGIWQFAMYLLALIWIPTSLSEKVPFLSNFRLPLVAFLSNAIHREAFNYHKLRLVESLYGHTGGLDIEETFWIGTIMRIVSFVMIIIVAGTSWEGSIRPKSRQNRDVTSQMAYRAFNGHEAVP